MRGSIIITPSISVFIKFILRSSYILFKAAHQRPHGVRYRVKEPGGLEYILFNFIPKNSIKSKHYFAVWPFLTRPGFVCGPQYAPRHPGAQPFPGTLFAVRGQTRTRLCMRAGPIRATPPGPPPGIIKTGTTGAQNTSAGAQAGPRGVYKKIERE